MNIHEYQAKALFAAHDIPTLRSHIIHQGDDIQSKCDAIKDQPWIVKAQVHAGGRGKAGGIKIVEDPSKLEATVKNLLGKTLVTKQTGDEGLPINSVLLEEAINIKREIYLAMLVDRESNRVAIIASSEGGMDIEQVAHQSPEKITTHLIHPSSGLQLNQIRDIGYRLQLDKQQIKQLNEILENLYALFLGNNCSLVEINPLVVNAENNLVELDAKVNLDDNALFRHKNLQKLYDPAQQNASEVTAKKLGLSYIKLDGNIGCIVNGAGLAMATMDLIKHHGGEPANFLDVGGGTTKEKVVEAFKLVSGDPTVQSIFVNIFGGIVRCDLIAQGILEALDEVSLETAVIVLLQGTNAEQGKRLLENKSSKILPVHQLAEGAQKAIACAELSK